MTEINEMVIDAVAKAIAGDEWNYPNDRSRFRRDAEAAISAYEAAKPKAEAVPDGYVLPRSGRWCAFDLDECTVTVAMDSEAEVLAIIAALPSGSRIHVFETAPSSPPSQGEAVAELLDEDVARRLRETVKSLRSGAKGLPVGFEQLAQDIEVSLAASIHPSPDTLRDNIVAAWELSFGHRGGVENFLNALKHTGDSREEGA